MSIPLWMSPRRCCDNCANCRPRQWGVLVSGLAPWSPPACQTCYDLNGLFYVDWVGVDRYGHCVWAYDFPEAVCTVARMVLRVQPARYSEGRYVYPVSVYLKNASGGTVFWREKLYTDRFDCAHAADVSLGSLQNAYGYYTCATTGSDVKISALAPCRVSATGAHRQLPGGFRCPFGPLLPLGK